MEFDTVLGDEILEDFANFGAHDALQGADSMPMIETSLLAARALPTSIPMKEEPTTTTFFPFCSPTALRMACTSGMVRRRKMLESSLKPGRGNALGVPPVARMSLVYEWEEPEAE